MEPMTITAFSLAERFIGMREVPGTKANPAILSMLNLDGASHADDAVPWCSAFMNYIAWLLRLPRSKSLAARSWLSVGIPIRLEEARAEFDVVILNRANGPIDPNVIKAPGHVGFYASYSSQVYLLGGNQADSVTVAPFDPKMVLGVRRLR